MSEYWASRCDFFWGSHGCDLPAGHTEKIHRCGSKDEGGPCCEYDESAPPEARVRWWQPEGVWDEWKPYSEGWRQ